MCATAFRFAAVVTMTTSSTITQTTDMVTVRLGEAIHLSCVITLAATESVSEVRWHRGSSFIPYGSIDVTSGCGHVVFPCPEESTTDNRGTVRYEIGTSNDSVMNLTISSSTLEDNTSFPCGIIRGGGSYQTSSGISVTVYVPASTTPITDHQTTLGTTTTESTTKSPDTTTGDMSISPLQTSTTSDRDTTSTTRPNSNTDELVPTSPPITTTSGQTPLMVPTTSIKPDPGPSFTMTTGVAAMTGLTTAPGAAGPPISTTIIAVAVPACVVIIIILLVIVACLVSSRRSRINYTEPTLLSLTAPETNSQDENVNRGTRQDTDASHIYEGTLRRNAQQQDVESSTSQQAPPVYATPNTSRRKLPLPAACIEAPQHAQYAVPRSRGRRDEYEDPERGAVEPGSDKAGYPPSESDPPSSDPPKYATIDPHSRPSSLADNGNGNTAVHMTGRQSQTGETTRGEDAGVARRPQAEIQQPPEYALQEPDVEHHRAGIPEHSSPEYAMLEPDAGVVVDDSGTENQDAGIPEQFSADYATLEPDAGVVVDDSGTENQDAGIPEQFSPEYATLEPHAGVIDDESGIGHQDARIPELSSPE